ncbi:MAG TPA: hypothetical protein VFW02_07620 [Candidatus Limnocylindrales bacterium]|nr:hypothetical protein [Candidatus Limnocylindrales bacterium]
MTDPTNPTPPDEPKADETFTWTSEAASHDAPKGAGAATAANILDSVRDVVDELAERAAPTVRQLSARAAELTAIAADKAAPLAKRAGEVTADASGKLASKSREWASELRASVATAEHPVEPETGTDAPTPGVEPAEGSSGTTEESGQG